MTPSTANQLQVDSQGVRLRQLISTALLLSLGISMAAAVMILAVGVLLNR
jgi:hypothetical protein